MSEDERFEFGSGEWLAQAERLLEAVVAERAASLEGVRFCMSETVTNPPAHLVPAGDDRLAWWFEFDGPNVKVGTGFRADADYTASDDYDAVLPLVRTVYREHPEVLAQLDAPPVAIPPPVLRVMLEFHDRLARRTR